MPARPSMLVTSGPTHEPIDRVRYIANRSSGRTGLAIADAAARRGWTATVLLGPSVLRPSDPTVRLHRFRTCADLGRLLDEHWPAHRVLVAAAAVADFTPAPRADAPAKIRRSEGRPLTLTLEPTPDLLRRCAARRREGQIVVGFSLSEPDQMVEVAREKLHRKSLDGVVANALETMDGPTIAAAFLYRSGSDLARIDTPGEIDKEAFGEWLVERIEGVFGVRP